MKRIYVAPLTAVVKIKSEKMICASGGDRIVRDVKTEATYGNLDKDYDDEDVFDDLW